MRTSKVELREGWVRIGPAYAATQEGAIMSLFSGEPLSLGLGTNGRYLFAASLFGDDKPTTHYVHVEVCKAFHGPRPDDLVVSHINGDMLDNRASNLVWETQAENLARREAHGTIDRGLANSRAAVMAAQVIDIRDRATTGETHLSIAQSHGVSRATVSRIVNRRRYAEVKEDQAA